MPAIRSIRGSTKGDTEMIPRSRDPGVSLTKREDQTASAEKRHHGRAIILPWQKKFLAVFVAFALALVLAELGLRFLWANPFRGTLPDDVVKIRTNHPNIDMRLNRGLINSADPWINLRTDARGYIRPSFQFKNPDATVAFLGGSTTQCSAVKEKLRFPALVSTLLSEQGLKVNTLNAAYAGNTLHDALNILINHVVQDRPDWVVLSHATNDVGVLAKQGSYRSRMGRPVSLGGIGKWLMQMASGRLYLAGLVRSFSLTMKSPRDPAYLAWRNDPAHADLPFDLYRQRLRAFVHLCRDFGMKPVLMTQPLSGEKSDLTPEWADLGAQGRCNAIIRSVGKELNVPVIDLVRDLHQNVPDWDKDENVFYDGMHVNDQGSRIYAEYIATQLRELILNRFRLQSEQNVHATKSLH